MMSRYITDIRYRIGDIDGKVYSDEALTNFITQAVYDLQSSLWYKKFEIVDETIVSKNDNTVEATDEELSIIYIQTQIFIAYQEMAQFARQGILVKDLRGTIDTRKIPENIKEEIKILYKTLKHMIENSNRNKARSKMGPQKMSIQRRTPAVAYDSVTYKTRYMV